VVAGACTLLVFLVMAHSNASAASASLRIAPSHGTKVAVFQFTYTVTLSPADKACSDAELTLTWDDQYVLGSVPQDCSSTERARGALTPTGQANNGGVHKLCVGNPDAGAPIACASLTIDVVPGSCEAQGLTAPQCVDTPEPYHGDCIPNTQQSSPPCVTTTPIPIVCDTTRLGPSPPCAETPVPARTPMVEPVATPTAGCDDPACATASATATPARTLTATATPTETSARICDTTAAPAARACVTATPSSGAADGGDDVSVNWTAVALAAGIVAATGGASAAGWVLLKRG
jgi:hypothetical protein